MAKNYNHLYKESSKKGSMEAEEEDQGERIGTQEPPKQRGKGGGGGAAAVQYHLRVGLEQIQYSHNSVTAGSGEPRHTANSYNTCLFWKILSL